MMQVDAILDFGRAAAPNRRFVSRRSCLVAKGRVIRWGSPFQLGQAATSPVYSRVSVSWFLGHIFGHVPLPNARNARSVQKPWQCAPAYYRQINAVVR